MPEVGFVFALLGSYLWSRMLLILFFHDSVRRIIIHRRLKWETFQYTWLTVPTVKKLGLAI